MVRHLCDSNARRRAPGLTGLAVDAIRSERRDGDHGHASLQALAGFVGPFTRGSCPADAALSGQRFGRSGSNGEGRHDPSCAREIATQALRLAGELGASLLWGSRPPVMLCVSDTQPSSVS
jgi:hypothetical protein